MTWTGLNDRLTGCYIFKLNTTWYSTKNKQNLVHSNLNSSMRPVAHTESLFVSFPFPISRSIKLMILTVPIALLRKTTYQMGMTLNLINFIKLNWMALSETYGSQMIKMNYWHQDRENNLLKQGVCITFFRKRNVVLQTCFSLNDPLCFCSDIDGIFKCLSLNHDPAE